MQYILLLVNEKYSKQFSYSEYILRVLTLRIYNQDEIFFRIHIKYNYIRHSNLDLIDA